MTALEQVLSDPRYAAFLASHGGDLRAACGHVRAAADRLHLPPPTRMTVGEMQEATTCTGCVTDLARAGGRLVRVVAGHPACPAHAGARP